MTCSSILGITLDVFSSPKSVRNYSSHQNRWGETCYIVVTNKMFFSVIKSVLKSSLNSVQSYRNKKIRVKNVTEFSEKNVIHREGRRSVHWIRWQKRKFTEFSDEFFTGGYSAHIWFWVWHTPPVLLDGSAGLIVTPGRAIPRQPAPHLGRYLFLE